MQTTSEFYPFAYQALHHAYTKIHVLLRQFDKKVTYQLREQGFNNILDLSNDGGKPYFMQDTIHLGWHGWLTVDKSVKPFLDGKDKVNKNNNYKINNYFYSDQWQKAEGQELNNIIK